jgi:hypothetical protein
MNFTLFFLALFASNLATAEVNFQGAIPNPQGFITETPSQLQIRFPEEMQKETKEYFAVSCKPAIAGFSGWADNNTLWTYDFKVENEEDDVRMAGGAKCEIRQIEALKSSSGKVWANGSIQYSVAVKGPNVTSVQVARGFNNTLRESNPVLLINFNGPVDRDAFFQEQSGYLSYLSNNAPGEKLALAPIPAEQQEKILAHFNDGDYWNKKSLQAKNWILATVNQNLIPGADVQLTVEKQKSAENSDVRSDLKHVEKFSVRSSFQAKVVCTNPSAKGDNCMPKAPIVVDLNGWVKWADLREAYIEYIPYKSEDQKPVRSFAEIPADKQIGFWDQVLIMLANYFPFLAKYNDTVLNQVVFNVNIEPQTTAKVVLPANLADVEGRLLANALAEFAVKIGAMDEFIRTPSKISFFEKKMDNLYLPVGVVNQNQKIVIRKSGNSPEQWMAVDSFPQMIQMIRGFSTRDEYRTDPNYVSPLQELSIPNSVVEQTLTGQKNRPTVLQFPFGNQRKSGLYAIEVSSPSLEESLSHPSEDLYYNPKAVLAQVTDLSIHLKKGTDSTLAWVTKLSTGEPVANADLEIYNCNGDLQERLQTNEHGLVSFVNRAYAESCNAPEGVYSEYLVPEHFYVGARSGDDLTFLHSSWASTGAYVWNSPGMEYFYSNISENRAAYHAIIGVNLVKPGQSVPVEILAKVPTGEGFSEVAANQLATKARIVSDEDNELFFDFPLGWSNGKAQLTWKVPADASAKLGTYRIQLINAQDQVIEWGVGQVEVAEFKIPLMSGLIAFPNQELVKPNSIPVNASIRYANGVGAKNLDTSISYFFAPTNVDAKDFPEFIFGSGSLENLGKDRSQEKTGLPNSQRPALIEGLKTGADGSLLQDLAKEKVADGRSVEEVMQTLERPQRLVVRVRYQDQMGEFQTLSQAKILYNANSYLGTNLLSGERSKARLQAALVGVDQKNLSDLNDLTFSITRIETKVIGEELFGGLIKNTLEREFKPVRWEAKCAVEKKAVSCPVGTLKEGSYGFEVKSKATGLVAHHLFKVDGNGRVYGPNDYYSFGDDENNKQLPLALNKETYNDGERAVVSFSAPFKACSALVTLERANVMEAFVDRTACQTGQVSVPVKAQFAPNTFVSVYAVTGRAQGTAANVGELDLGRPTYRLGFANVKVNWDRFRAAVAVKTDKQKYQPGETVNVEVAVSATNGNLSGSTVTLVALEEKILELKENKTYAVLEALMQMRGHSVATITPLERIETVTGEYAEPVMGAPRKGGDEGGDGSSASEFKRKLFDALVTFQTNIPVVNGVAKANFKANDSLTRFKVFAIVTDASHKFGTAEVVYLSEKDTQSYANIPSVAHTGDKFPLQVTVQNNSTKDGKFKAEISVVIKDKNGKVIGQEKLTKEALIEKSGSKAISLGDLQISDDASSIEYVVRIYDENGKLVDVMEPAPQFILPSIPLSTRDTLIAQLENGALKRVFTKEATALPGQGTIQAVASKSLVTTVLTQIVQRTDRDPFADFFIINRLNRALLKGSEKKTDEVQEVLGALLGYLDANGFVKYFPQARQGDVALTAAVLHSLELEPWSVALMPSALKGKLKGAVLKVLERKVPANYVGTEPMDWMRAQALMVRAAFLFGDEEMGALAQQVRAGIINEVKTNQKPFGFALSQWTNSDLINVWLMDIRAGGKGLESPLFKLLVGPARLVYSGNTALLNGGPAYGWYYTDETIETSKLLLGLAQSRGDGKLARALALGLTNHSARGWYNSSTTMAVAEGLKGFGRVYEAEKVTGVTTIRVPEEQTTVTVDFAQKVTGGVTAPFTREKATVEVNHKGSGKPWVSLQSSTAVPLTAARGAGMNLEKTIRNVTREGAFQAGDVIEVTLTIHANSPLRHVAVLDPIPAGANILAEAYGAYSSGQKSYSGYKLYFDFLGNGATVVKYQYQLNNPGSFKLPPTKAEALFQPSIFAETPNAAVQVQ